MIFPLEPTMNAEFFGDHPALDLINTVMQVNGQAVDVLQSDEDVLRWLALAGYPPDARASAAPPKLLATLRALRGLVREMVERRKAGETVDAAPLNAMLAHANRHVQLVADGEGRLGLKAVYASDTAPRLLAPLAEAAAGLIAGDFDLVKHCENPECSLWFLDRTKSHRRRWCSMAACGNRHKVASFRLRQQK